ncbi:MAG: DEAD/DEAH box helicase, partial [Candidatus Eisenbacteria bacterium]|nr:DEAD/DEAH box helicase [Candidatus Eisenbacteria bacterium]
ELAKKIADAVLDGRSEVELDGQTIPASAQSLDAVRQIAEVLGRPPQQAGDVDREPAGEEPDDEGAVATEPEVTIEGIANGPIALLVDDNLEEVTYEATPRVRGEVGSVRPTQLSAQLYPHQEAGLRWLQDAWATGLPGVLLADDMGLGKTLQVLAFLAWIREFRPGDSRPILIVAPTGLIRNWMAEADRHLGYGHGPVAHGSDAGASRGLGHPIAATGAGLQRLRLPEAARGRETDGGMPVLDVDRLRSASWVLTTYESLRDYQHSFGRVDWSVLVLDEVQKIKNPVALATDAVKAMNADFRVALTGTPVENHIADLWSIVDAIFPGRLGALREFVKGHQAPEELQQLREDLLEGQAPTLVLRRMKEDHLRGLPEIVRHVDEGRRQMPPAQVAAYDEIVEKIRAGAGKGFMMVGLQELRLVSVHPDVLSTDDPDDYIRASAKLSYVFEILDKIRNASEKALIFLDSLNVQGSVASLIQARYRLRRMPMILNGTVSGARRATMVETFQSEPDQFDVMILSPKAGGVGLTLTEANHVIHLMRWWNPAVEDQATDRAYRIGQRRPVHVYLPTAVHPEQAEYSFDLRLHELLERKRGLSRQLLAPD